MRKFLFVAAAAVALASCTTLDIKQGIHPMTPDVNLHKVDDGVYPAVFSTKDFNWRGSNLMLTLYSEDIYEGKSIDNLQPGDTVYFREDTIVVKGTKVDKNFIEINGGIEQNGAMLQKTKDGNYRGMQLDDHSTYTLLGKTALMLADDFTIIDCGDNPEDANDTIRTNQKKYLEGVKEYKRDFSELNTLVTVKEGIITKITRRWIP